LLNCYYNPLSCIKDGDSQNINTTILFPDNDSINRDIELCNRDYE
jgi:hypothetical protein